LTPHARPNDEGSQWGLAPPFPVTESLLLSISSHSLNRETDGVDKYPKLKSLLRSRPTSTHSELHFRDVSLATVEKAIADMHLSNSPWGDLRPSVELN